MLNKSNTMGVTNRTETANPSATPDYTRFLVALCCVAQSLGLCEVLCQPLFLSFYVFSLGHCIVVLLLFLMTTVVFF